VCMCACMRACVRVCVHDMLALLFSALLDFVGRVIGKTSRL